MSTGRAGVRDWAIAVGVAAVLLVAGLSADRSTLDSDLLGYPLLAAGGLALAARRRWPVAVLAVTGLCAVGYQAVGFDVPAVAFLFAVYTGVRAGHRVVTVAAAVLMLVALPLTALAPPRTCTTGPSVAMPASLV
ncbi:sensor histidine kinase, partial [Micromonospora sp. NPDC049580]